MTPILPVVMAGGKPRSLREASIPNDARVLVIGPHPDDFDAIGVTLKFLADRGNPLRAGVVPTWSGIGDSYRAGLSLAEKTELRIREQRQSLRFFGLPEEDLTFLPLLRDAEEDQVQNIPANLEILTAFIREKQPDLLFLPHGNDSNAGHRAMFALVRQAVRISGRPIQSMLIRDPKTTGMRLDWYMPFDQPEADWKATMLRFHDTQQQRNLDTRGRGFDERILAVNRQIARELSLDSPYAEAFEAFLFDGRD